MNDINGFQRDLLYVISGRSRAKGVDIREVMADYYGQKIHHGRLYPSLDTLADKGLIRKGDINDRSNYYEITDRGERELEARRDWEDEVATAEA